MADFKALKKNNENSFDRLNEQLAKINSKGGAFQDDRMWQPEVDQLGNGYAVIRFLPAPPDEDMPFVQVYDHIFRGPSGKWYRENSLTTKGAGTPDPVSEYNRALWAKDTQEAKDQVRKMKRRNSYYSNILVVDDPKNPDNNGKVFLFRYGKKIFDKLQEAMNPPFEGDPRINPFDLWKGANLTLKIRKVDGYRNYDSSVFGEPKPAAGTDKELEAIWRAEHSLADFIADDKFKTYEELKAIFMDVMGLDDRGSTIPAPSSAPKEDQKMDFKPSFDSAPAKMHGSAESEEKAPWEDDSDSNSSDEDSSMSFFDNLSRKE